MFFRQAPVYRAGILVKISKERISAGCHMLIQKRRWIRPNNQDKKQWVYDGILLEIQGEKIKYSTSVSCVFESSIELIPGIS